MEKHSGKMRTTAETLEKVLALLEEIRERSSSGTAILVEGKNDAAALKRLQIKENIRILKKKETLLNVLENIGEFKEAIILTDFDKRGTRIAGFCAKHLRGLGVKPDLETRRKLRGLVGKEVKDIEGLASYVEHLRAKCLPVRSMRGTF